MSHAIRMHDERVAFQSLEKLVWPRGPVCPHCGMSSRVGRLNGLSTSVGAWKCYSCRKPFTVKHGTIFHNSHVQMHVWLQALYLLIASKQRISSPRLGHILGVSVRTAWHLKVKIVNALDSAEFEDSDTVVWQPNDRVVRSPAEDEQAGKLPGQAASIARYQRFLAAIEGLATEETDRIFLQALSRLLSADARFERDSDEAFNEQQLEFGLFSELGHSMSGAEHARAAFNWKPGSA